MRTLEPMSISDIRGVVSLHIRSFPSFFLSFMGAGFLHQLFLGIIECPLGFAVVMKEEDRILAFCIGVDNLSEFYRWLIKHRLLYFGAASFVPILIRPSIVPRLLRAFSAPQTNPSARLLSATLMSIGVEPKLQGQGIGRRIMDEFLKTAQNRGASKVDLVTDAENNNQANKFYKSVGFKLINQLITREGRRMNHYLFDFE